jgi:amidase
MKQWVAIGGKCRCRHDVNATGTPAMNVPLHRTADGLPVGVHFAGRYGEEATLLALAAELETAQPWFSRAGAVKE